jgi:acid phosphatase type 7
MVSRIALPSLRRYAARRVRGALPALGLGLAAACAFAPGAPAFAAANEAPPRFHVAAPADGALSFVVYGDTRFTQRKDVANARARRALVARIAAEQPAAILVGGDLVYAGDDPEDYATYHEETAAWARQKIPVFAALGNHELSGCDAAEADSPCLERWWRAFPTLELRPWRWYSVQLGSSILALVLDSGSPLKPGSEQLAWLEHEVRGADADARTRFILMVLHYPPVRDPIFPHVKDEREVQRFLSATAGNLRVQVIVVGSHIHNYERFERDGVTYLVSGGGGAKPHPAFRMSGELSQLKTGQNFHYLRFTLAGERLTGTMVRFDADSHAGDPWSEPDRFEITAKPAARGADAAIPLQGAAYNRASRPRL